MGIRLLLGRKSSVALEDLTFDAVINENHPYKNVMTKNKVEDGYVVTDHIKREPLVLTMTVFVTDYPVIHPGYRAEILAKNQGQAPTTKAFLKLLEYAGFDIPTESGVTRKAKAPIPVDVFTTLRVYTGLFLTTIIFPVLNSSMEITLILEELRVVESQTTTIPKVASKTSSTKNIKDQAQTNNKSGKETPKDTNSESILYKGGKWLKNKFTGWYNAGN